MGPRKESTKPFPEAVQELLDELDMSRRELVRKTRANGWGSTGTMSFIMNGEYHPTTRAITEFARVLGVKPEHFAEFRLARARDSLDERVVGLKTALKNLG